MLGRCSSNARVHAFRYDAEGGEIKVDKDLEFEFTCPKQYESYHGLNARVQYVEVCTPPFHSHWLPEDVRSGGIPYSLPGTM